MRQQEQRRGRHYLGQGGNVEKRVTPHRTVLWGQRCRTVSPMPHHLPMRCDTDHRPWDRAAVRGLLEEYIKRLHGRPCWLLAERLPATHTRPDALHVWRPARRKGASTAVRNGRRESHRGQGPPDRLIRP